MKSSARRLRDLPSSLRRWNTYERELLHRHCDTERLAPFVSKLDSRYMPDGGRVFRVPAFWVDCTRARVFRADPVGERLESRFFRHFRGRQEVLILVHPSALRSYRHYLRNAGARRAAGPGFWGSPTASARTLLLWDEDAPDEAFFAKLSIPVTIDGSRRTLTPEHIAHSVGVTAILKGETRLPRSFSFLPEELGVAPRGLRNHGYIIRSIPAEILHAKNSVVPFFALCRRRGTAGPLLLELISGSGMSSRAFVRRRICRPFAAQWLSLTMNHGLIPEPHAQNLLLELDVDEKPTGRFVHRDFESFCVDVNFRVRAGRFLPKYLPATGRFSNCYPTNALSERMIDSLLYHFQGGILYTLDSVLGWDAGEVESMFLSEMSGVLKRRTGDTVDLTKRRYAGLIHTIRKSKARQCRGDTGSASRPAMDPGF